MSAAMNPAAPHYLPVFITAPGEPDVFLNGAAIFLVVAVISLGSVYFRLHALPERMAHKNASKIQFELVAVLALLALFTHNTIFWFAALLLALVPIPDFYEPLSRMADSLAKMAGLRRQTTADEPSADPSATEKPPEPASSDAADASSRPQVLSAAPEQPDRNIQAAG
ncbi:MAG TPA: hypothetical protein VIZ90_03555 [Rhizobiaceae bacterium]